MQRSSRFLLFIPVSVSSPPPLWGRGNLSIPPLWTNEHSPCTYLARSASCRSLGQTQRSIPLLPPNSPMSTPRVLAALSLAWGAIGSFGVGCWRGVLPGPWRGVLPGPLAWGGTRSLSVGCYRVLWRGVLPGPLAWGATRSFGVGCYRVLWRGVLPGPLAWGGTGSLGVGWYRLTLGGVVPAHFARGATRSLGLVHLRVGAGGRHSVPTSWLEVSPPCWRCSRSGTVASDPVRVSETERSQYSVTLHAWSQFDCRRLQRSFWPQLNTPSTVFSPVSWLKASSPEKMMDHVTCQFEFNCRSLQSSFWPQLNSFVSNLLTKSVLTGEDDGMFWRVKDA